VEKNNSVAVILPYVPFVDDTDKEETKVSVKLANGNKVFLSHITVSANLESFLVKSIAARNNVLNELTYKAQAEKIEEEMKTNKKMIKLDTNTTSAATATQAENKSKQEKADEAKKIAEAQANNKKQMETLAVHYVKLEDQLKRLILKTLDTFGDT